MSAGRHYAPKVTPSRVPLLAACTVALIASGAAGAVILHDATETVPTPTPAPTVTKTVIKPSTIVKTVPVTITPTPEDR